MVLEIDMALVKRCNLDKLDITISPTLRTQWKIWMPCCLYSNSSWDSSICCIRRQGLGLATSSISIYENRKTCQVSARKENVVTRAYACTISKPVRLRFCWLRGNFGKERAWGRTHIVLKSSPTKSAPKVFWRSTTGEPGMLTKSS